MPKKTPPPICPSCGTKLLPSGKCIKANFCEPFRANHDSLMQKIREQDKAKR